MTSNEDPTRRDKAELVASCCDTIDELTRVVRHLTEVQGYEPYDDLQVPHDEIRQSIVRLATATTVFRERLL
ncbi:MAG TPA: hypothetical protein VM715_12615 [Candidatus Acidoferrum sp.]|jgi:hypothetical protein|nr:hypothetical protein [Candidatus Acidoferrum sp.]